MDAASTELLPGHAALGCGVALRPGAGYTRRSAHWHCAGRPQRRLDQLMPEDKLTIIKRTAFVALSLTSKETPNV